MLALSLPICRDLTRGGTESEDAGLNHVKRDSYQKDDCNEPLNHVWVLKDECIEHKEVKAFAYMVIEELEVLENERETFIGYLELL